MDKGGEVMNTRIRELRKMLGMTQQEFADRLGLKRGTITNYELGRNEPLEAVLSFICQTFCVNREWLENGTGEPFGKVNKENQLMMWAAGILRNEDNSFQRRFLSMLMSLEPSDWKTLEKIAALLQNDGSLS